MRGVYEVANTSTENERKNKKLKEKYDRDPREFWNSVETRDGLPSFFVDFAIFIFSLMSSSANSERAFSQMSLMIGSRRSGITASNVDKRLTLCNQLPQNRILMNECKSRNIKRVKLSESLFVSK